MKKNIRYIFALLGIVIFVVLFYRMGPSTVLMHLSKVRWWILLVVFLPVIWYSLHTLAWYQFLRDHGKIKFFELFRVKVIGEALNTATPVNFIAGDPARAFLIRHHYPITEGTASVIVDRTLYAMSTLILVLVGTGFAFVELDFLPKNIKYGLPIVLAVAISFVLFVFFHQRRGLFILLADIAQKLKLKSSFSTVTLQKFKEMDGHIQDFYKENKRGFILALCCHLAGRFLGVFEFFIIGHAANAAFSFKVALLLGASAPIISAAFAFIPGSLGVMESASSAILYFMGFPASLGLTIQIVRRLRGLLWMSIAFIFFGARKHSLIKGGQRSIVS